MRTGGTETMLTGRGHTVTPCVEPRFTPALQLALGLPERYVEPAIAEHESTHTVNTTKQLGAYYTDEGVADFLVRWAMRPGRKVSSVLDPSCGDGVFLRAACRAFARTDSQRLGRVLGVDIDPSAAALAHARLSRESTPASRELVVRDFFELAAGTYSADVVVGNPPFVRFHRFSGNQRATALARAAEQGVRLSGLSSSWAPFLVHSVGMLRTGGQLAMVLPFEITYAVYSRPVLAFLARMFRQTTILTFRQPLFPELNESTVLLLAAGKGEGPGVLSLLDLASARDLLTLTWDETGSVCGAYPLEASPLAGGNGRLAAEFLPPATRRLWRQLMTSHSPSRLGEVADVGIGYVTGANGFFHLSPEAVRAWGVPTPLLAQAVVRSRALCGLAFTSEDWEHGLNGESSAYLLNINGAKDLPESVLRYLALGESRGIPAAYKCRVRQPWYSVPHVAVPDGFLTYMSHEWPRVIANACGAVAPNTLHCVRVRRPDVLSGQKLALLWCNSLTALSCELEGHPLGGGMLKLEPGEARRVVLPPLPSAWTGEGFAAVFAEMDAAVRGDKLREVIESVDRLALGDAMGISDHDCQLLREGVRLLRDRRLHRGGS